MHWEEHLRSFLDAEQRLIAFPSKRKKKLWALLFFAAALEENRQYTEKEINALVLSRSTFEDPETIRRELYEYKFLNRSKDGRAYWRVSPQPAAADLGLWERES